MLQHFIKKLEIKTSLPEYKPTQLVVMRRLYITIELVDTREIRPFFSVKYKSPARFNHRTDMLFK